MVLIEIQVAHVRENSLYNERKIQKAIALGSRDEDAVEAGKA